MTWNSAKSLSTLSLLLCASLLLTESASGDDSQLAKLQGTWVGKESGKEDKGEVRLVIQKKKVTYKGWKEGEWYSGEIELSEVDGVLHLVGIVKDAPVKKLIGLRCNGIYTLEDGVFTLTSRGPGDPDDPTGFDDPKCRTITLKKAR